MLARNRLVWAPLAATWLAVPSLFAACSASGGSRADFAGASTGGSGASGGIIGFDAASADLDARAPNSGLTPDSACAAETREAHLKPLAMYIEMDQSGSMTQAVTGGTRWAVVSDALGKFVQAPSASGIAVGMGFFPKSQGACLFGNECGTVGQCDPLFGVCRDVCNSALHANPDVPIEPLPGVAGKVLGALGAHQPGGGTPTSVALQGALDHSRQWLSNNPEYTMVVVLATDGEPQGCDENVANIAAIAASGLPDIQTYVIGIGKDLSVLEQIATAGGGKAYIVDGSGNTGQEFADAMNEIRGAALVCEFDVPQPEQGELDFGRVNMLFTPEGGGASDTIPYVASASECDAVTGGWYYDDPDQPKKIIVCDSTCTVFRTLMTGKVEVLLGCQTVLK